MLEAPLVLVEAGGGRMQVEGGEVEVAEVFSVH